jgi:hypothetical protein
MATTTTDPQLTRAELVRIVRSGKVIKGVPRMRALAALQQRDRKDFGDILLEVVADTGEQPRFRHMAAMGLYRLGGPRGREALVAAARTADEVSAPAIALGLGRIGTADALPTVERLGEVAAAHARDRTRFAATLLAYRHGLDGHEVRAPARTTLQEVTDDRTQPIELGEAAGRDARLALEALTDEPLEVDLTTDRAVRIDCEPNTFVWLWTKEAAQAGFSPLVERKGVAGVLFRKRHFVNAYVVSTIGLATPTRGGTRLTLHRAATGPIVYAGDVATDGSGELRARSRPGLAAMVIRARVDSGSVDVADARSAITSREGRSPKRS